MNEFAKAAVLVDLLIDCLGSDEKDGWQGIAIKFKEMNDEFKDRIVEMKEESQAKVVEMKQDFDELERRDLEIERDKE